MRIVTVAAKTEEELLSGLKNIPGYELKNDVVGTYHPFTLITPSGAQINLLHTEGSSTATTTNISPQDHNETEVPFSDDEAVKFADAANKVEKITAVLDISDADKEKIKS